MKLETLNVRAPSNKGKELIILKTQNATNLREEVSSKL